MGKYGKMGRHVPPPQRPWDVHPIWRGIGCLLILIGIPVAYAAADILVRMNLEAGWIPVPAQMRQSFTFPWVGITLENAGANLLLGIILLLLGFALIIMVYSLVYSILGPSRYGPVDSPPIRTRRR